MIINHNMRPLLIFPHMLLKMFVKYVPRTPVQRSSGGPNVGEICSSSNRPISAACWMSYRYFLASSCIEQGLVTLNTLAKVRILDGRFDDQIHRPPEELLQGLD